MKLRSFIYALFGLMLATTLFAKQETPLSTPKAKTETKAEQTQNDQKNEPLFKDGKGYYSYTKSLNLPTRQDGKVQIQYFYQYGCNVCLHGLDNLKMYAERNAEKVALQYSPSFSKNNAFTSRMHATFVEYGRPELSDLFLFDSLDRKANESLTENNRAIERWLTRHNVDVSTFYKLFNSEQVKKRVTQDVQLFRQYNALPLVPIAILDGKYILAQNTLYNDDYTFAVLDFLIEKLQQEK